MPGSLESVTWLTVSLSPSTTEVDANSLWLSVTLRNAVGACPLGTVTVTTLSVDDDGVAPATLHW